MNMRECRLYPPVRDWLTSHGYEIHVEIFGCDIVALKDGKITAVELKKGYTRTLVNQLTARAQWADFVIAAIPGRIADFSVKKRTGGARYSGFGLLIVEGGKVFCKVHPKPQPNWWHKRHAYRLKKLIGRAPAQDHELAGLPSCPQLRLQREARVEA